MRPGVTNYLRVGCIAEDAERAASLGGEAPQKEGTEEL